LNNYHDTKKKVLGSAEDEGITIVCCEDRRLKSNNKNIKKDPHKDENLEKPSKPKKTWNWKIKPLKI